VAGVALGDIDLHFAWQALTFTLPGRRGTYGTGLPLVARLVPSGCRCRCGCWRGRRGAWRHRPSLCVAGVALGDMDLHLAWQAWHVWHWAASGGALGSQWTRLSVAAAVGVASVALGDIDLHFVRQALHFRAMDLHFAWQVWHLETWTFTLHGRHGTYGTGLPRMSAWFPFDAVVAAAVGVAGVALGDIDVRLAWQAWHLVTSMLQVTPSFTHNFVTHIFVTHNLVTHIFVTHNFVTHNFVTHHLSHTIFHTQLCHTQLCQTHNLSHTTLRHTTLHIQFLK